MQALRLHAGPAALRHIQANGLSPADIGAIPAAAGGPKGLILLALDRFIFGDWLVPSSHRIELMRLQRELGVAYLFITHDLRLVPRIANRVVVMYLGQVVEEGPASLLERSRLHPYSQALFGAVPRIEPATPDRPPRRLLEGEIPSPIDPPAGCRFHTRCPHRQERCSTEAPK